MAIDWTRVSKDEQRCSGGGYSGTVSKTADGQYTATLTTPTPNQQVFGSLNDAKTWCESRINATLSASGGGGVTLGG
jgi:hypothetical protein